MLYLRMVVLMVANLYASRIVLAALGEDDYGLYSVVGGIVVFLGFINLSMTASSQRFLAYSAGVGDKDAMSRMFNSVLAVHVLLGVVILAVGEACGLFYIYNYLNVEPGKIGLANIVFQFALLSFVVKTVTVPYHASIIANERMHVFAWFSLIEGGLQLGCALLIANIADDRLAVYSATMFGTVFTVQMCYRIYSSLKFKECKFKRNWERKSIREIFAYSGWNLFGSFSAVCIDQGLNMVLNSFFGLAVNAARAVAFQVSAAVGSLAGNLQQAINPQIVKSDASHDKERNFSLIVNGTRLSFFLLAALALPIYFNLGSVLDIWLEEVPGYALGFCRWIIVISLLSAFSNSLITGAMATGRIKRYQIIVASINLCNIPLSIWLLHYFPDPYVTFYVMFGLGLAAFAARLIISGSLLEFSRREFMRRAVLPCLVAGVLAVAIIGGLNMIIPSGGIWLTLLRLMLYFLITVAAVYAAGVNRSERKKINATVRDRVKPYFSR